MKLNPHKLEAFYQSHKLTMEEQMETLKCSAWLHGAYVRLAVASCLNGRKVSYPETPMELEEAHDMVQDNNAMTDGQRFALFAVKHNKARKQNKA